MTTKEKVIRKSISRIEWSLEQIDAILEANPVQEIISIRKEAQTLIETTTYHDQQTDDFLQKLKRLGERERKMFAIAGKNPVKLIRRKVKLQMELDALKIELYFIEQKKTP